jgi:SAM-dependent methyltransferase
MLDEDKGPSLDAGCAVGRFTFEMAVRSGTSVGIELSRPFVELARSLSKGRSVRFRIPVEGEIEEDMELTLPEGLLSGQVEFVIADAEALPFRDGVFKTIASLNIIDKLPRPLLHLREMDRVASMLGAQFLFSDPFSWSEDISPKGEWLGGKNEGPFKGYGIKNVAHLLSGQGGLSPWHVKAQREIWWKLRTHQNHFELIRSLALKAVRP